MHNNIRYGTTGLVWWITIAALYFISFYTIDLLAFDVVGTKMAFAAPFLIFVIVYNAVRTRFSWIVQGPLILIAIMSMAFLFYSLLASLNDVAVSFGDTQWFFYSLFVIPLTWIEMDLKQREIFGLNFFIALLIPCFVGWYRFVTGSGGMLSEHAIGYWGIKYMTSTRNSDVLIPVIAFASSVYCIFYTNLYGIFVRVLMSLASALIVLSIVLSQSRGAWIALLVMILFLIKDRGKGALIYLGCLLAIGGVVILIVIGENQGLLDILVFKFQSIVSVDASGVTNSNQERGGLIFKAVNTWIKYPFGVGINAFPELVRFQGDGVGFMNHAENLFVTILVELGVLGFLGVVAYFIASLSRGYALQKRTGYALPFLVSLALFVYCLFNYEVKSLFFWCCIAISMQAFVLKRK